MVLSEKAHELRRVRGMGGPVFGLVACHLVTAATVDLAADQVLEIDRTIEERQNGVLLSSTKEKGVLYLGENRARFDQGEEASWVLLLPEKKQGKCGFPARLPRVKLTSSTTSG